MEKNIVICCDGTGQKLDVQLTNVFRLFSILDRSNPNAQVSYYEPGVGTIPATGALTWVSQQLTLKAGLIAGYGLLDNVSKAYSFLVDRYQDGDRVYLFGFSRGAYTVRVLAGLLHRIGVLRPEHKNLIPYALELYKPHYTRIKDMKRRKEASRVTGQFRDELCWPGRVDISFLGLWDTVKAFGVFWPRSLPHTRHNSDVRIVRHALALDERRRSFLPTSWGGLDDYVESAPSGQNVKEVWFAGSHSDVGGGYCEKESGLSWISFKWMIDEARNCCPELQFEKDKIADMLKSGIPLQPQLDLREGYWKLHPSRTKLWWFGDQIPRPELTNAPPRSANQRKPLEPGLSVPVGWPKFSFFRAFWPTTGRRRIEQFKRGGQVLIHTSVCTLIRSGKYPLEVDNRIAKWEPAPPPVRHIDHIMIRADDPGKLFAFFSETLQLPVAWPLATRGRVTSGGVGFGNVNVEAIRFPEQKPSPSQLVGFGFEPSPLGECLGELDRRGITYGELRPFVVTEQDGSKKTLFTNVTLRQFSDTDRAANATMHIFLSEYSPMYVNVEQRHARLRRELVESGGGPLGVNAVKEVIIGTTDLKTAIRLWEKLLEPRCPSAPGLWQVGNGPAIRVVQAGENELQGLVIRVVSFRQAKAFLQEKGLLGSVSEKEVTINPSKIQGLNIRLVEKE